MENKLEDRVNKVIHAINASYNGKKEIDRPDSFDYPSKQQIISIIRKLQNLIFIGYYHNEAYKVYTLQNNISMLTEDLIYNISKQIATVLRYCEKYRNLSDNEIQSASENIAIEFMMKIPEIRDYIEDDVQAAYEGDPAAYNKDEIIFSYPGLCAILIYRLAHELYKLEVPLIPRIMTEYAHGMTGIDINPGATIGRNFFIDHGTGIVIGETTIIGNNAKIYQGVTLGALSTRGGQNLRNVKRHPTLKDNVTIYSGASVLGGETVIGNDVVIGGNCFITKSVPDGAKVSIKTQELKYKYKDESEEFDPEKTWFYVI